MNKVSRSVGDLTLEEKRELARRLLNGHAAGKAAEILPIDPGLPPALYRFDHHPYFLGLRERQRAAGINPYFRLHDGIARDTTVIGGHEYLNFTNYNYLGLSGHPAVTAAAAAALERYGTSVSASRMVGGERPIHHALEGAIAGMLETEACLVFVSGHATNVTTISHLFGPKDLIVHDALIHNSVIMGAQLSGARRVSFRHNDWQAVDNLLLRHRRDYERVLIVVEGVYSMDGDFPDLPRFLEIRNRHKTFLMVDEAHSLGVMGARGRGIREHFGLAGDDVDIWMGTLSKALASCGGYVAGSAALIECLKYGAPGFVFSVGLPPANTATALAALEVIEAEPERVGRLRQRGQLFLRLAQERGLPTGFSRGVAVVPLIVGDSQKCLRLTEMLFLRGINVQPILYPAVEERSARLRFFLNCTHTEEQIGHAVTVIDEEWRKL